LGEIIAFGYFLFIKYSWPHFRTITYLHYFLSTGAFENIELQDSLKYVWKGKRNDIYDEYLKNSNFHVVYCYEKILEAF